MDAEIKHQVQDFYNQVGWQRISDQLYQNAIYEDLRPVSSEYIHKCHLRVNRHIKQNGRFLLDAGSGPVQWPEYLTYSAGYHFRICLDISMLALKEARQRLGEKGLYVVADITNLPFSGGVFDGVVSLHTLHHLPLADQKTAYFDIHRVLLPGSSAVIINGYSLSPMMQRFNRLMVLGEKLFVREGTKESRKDEGADQVGKPKPELAKGTFVEKNTYDWICKALKILHFEVFPWRSVSVRFLRSLIHASLGGKIWLKLLYWLEDRFPGWFARNGQYPMVIIYKEN